MSALGMLARGAVSGIWKIVTIVLAVLLLAALSGAGAGWWVLAGARDQAVAALVVERSVSAGLRGAIATQNSAVDQLAAATVAADARGQAAQDQAAVSGRRLDAALASIVKARASTCAEAMPAVNRLLEGVR